MNIPIDHECFQWVFSAEKSGRDSFYFKYNDDGEFGYVTCNNNIFYLWKIDLLTLEWYISNNRMWHKISPRPLFCGPIQPPPSKVILKIRQMEARRNHV